MAVHSAKDLPTEMRPGLAIAGYLPREWANDVLIVREDRCTPQSIATGSPRRRAQARLFFPDVAWKEIRGNVESRLEKIAAGEQWSASTPTFTTTATTPLLISEFLASNSADLATRLRASSEADFAGEPFTPYEMSIR